MSRGLRPGAVPVLDIGPEPETMRAWARSVFAHRDVLVVLAGKDFKVRYRSATFGVLWAVALPLVQSAVMIAVFSRVARFSDRGLDYPGYVLAGMAVWAFVSATVPIASTAIVDAASLTDKVWFPRALLVLSPVLANLIGLGIAVTLVSSIELARNGLGPQIVLLVPGAALAVALVTALALTAAALQVSFRDIRFIVQAGMLVAFYATPILYPIDLLGRMGDVVSVANPFVGPIDLFQTALTGQPLHGLAIASSAVWTLVLMFLAVHLHHRRDRLFVDLL